MIVPLKTEIAVGDLSAVVNDAAGRKAKDGEKTMKRECATCEWWDAYDLPQSVEALCRLSPPSNDFVPPWPRTKRNDWCSQWAGRVTEGAEQ